ncbi:hypothetical protein D3C80_2174410 [compost metagenome]
MHQTLFQPTDFLVGQGVIDRNGDTLGNLLQHPQVGGIEIIRLALRQLQHAEGFLAENQRQHAQRLNLLMP